MLKEGQWVPICSFKHSGNVHRMWDKSLVLEHHDGLLVVGNDAATVYEGDGRSWQVREPAITIFFEDKWYNVICMIRPDGIHYYVNIASPVRTEEDMIIYIDYDLDVGLKPNQPLKILDEMEYLRHKEKMKYPDRLDYLLKAALYEIIQKCNTGAYPFNDEVINQYYKHFMQLK